MSHNPLVSILTPCYNSQDYLERYLDSILKQTYSNLELIIINDGSQDRTEEIALSYIDVFQERGYSLVYVKQENKGLGGAINTGLKHIKGEYFAWCDSDNFYTNDYVEEKVNFFLKNPQYSIVRCDGCVVNETDLTKIKYLMSGSNTDKFQEDMFEYCLFVKNFHFGCAMLKTKDFDRVNPKREIYPSRHGQNWQLLLPMFYHYKSGYIDKPMFYFVERGNSISNIVKNQSKEKKYEQNEEYCKIILTTLREMHIPEYAKYEREIKVKYSKRNLCIAAESRDKVRLKIEFQVLKELRALDFRTRLVYLEGRSRVVSFVFQVMRKIKHMITQG